MVRLHETLETVLPPDDAFEFVADFANSARWDPGTRLVEAGGRSEPRVGARVPPRGAHRQPRVGR